MCEVTLYIWGIRKPPNFEADYFAKRQDNRCLSGDSGPARAVSLHAQP